MILLYDVLAIENEIVFFLGIKVLNFILIYLIPTSSIAGRLNWFWMRKTNDRKHSHH